MSRVTKTVFSIMLALVMFALIPSTRAYAYSEIPNFFDFDKTVITVTAGSEQKMWITAYYNYTYYIEGATSAQTYLECSFKSGSQYVTFHIGPDEQASTVYFHFYVDDDKVESEDVHDCIDVHVQYNQPPVSSLPMAAPNGKTGAIINGMYTILN